MEVRLKPMGLSSYYAAGQRFVTGHTYDISDLAVIRAVVDNSWFELDRFRAHALINGMDVDSPDREYDAEVAEESDAIVETSSNSDVVTFESPVVDDGVETHDPAFDSSDNSTDADDIFVNEEVVIEPAEVASASARNEFDKYDCPHEGCEKVGDNGFVRYRNVETHVSKEHVVAEEESTFEPSPVAE